MDNKDLELLEFPRIREIIAGYCSFSMSRELAISLSPSIDIEEINKRLGESAEAGKLLEEDSSVSANGVDDIRDYAVAASRGQVLDPKTLRIICTSLQTMRLLRSGNRPSR
jgi:DNA mismatch repair protein MutS2